MFLAKFGTRSHKRRYVFSHNSAILSSIGLKFFMGTRETMRIQWCDFDLWATFGVKMGVATTCASMGTGHQYPSKALANLEDLLGQRLSRNLSVSSFLNFRPEPSLPPFIHIFCYSIRNCNLCFLLLKISGDSTFYSF